MATQMNQPVAPAAAPTLKDKLDALRTRAVDLYLNNKPLCDGIACAVAVNLITMGISAGIGAAFRGTGRGVATVAAPVVDAASQAANGAGYTLGVAAGVVAETAKVAAAAGARAATRAKFQAIAATNDYQAGKAVRQSLRIRRGLGWAFRLSSSLTPDQVTAISGHVAVAKAAINSANAL